MRTLCSDSSGFERAFTHFRSMFSENCTNLFNDVFLCGENFASSLATNMRKEYKRSQKKKEQFGRQYVDFKGYISPDQQKDIDLICEKANLKCFEKFLNQTQCRGQLLLDAFLKMAIKQYINAPYEAFRCDMNEKFEGRTGIIKFSFLLFTLTIFIQI